MAVAGHRSEVYLIASIDNPCIAPGSFDAVSGAIGISCVLIKSAADPGHDTEAVRGIVQDIQSRDIAVLIDERPETAQELGADGVHLAQGDDLPGRYEAARSLLGDQAIVGVEISSSRHDAMTFAEQGADYIAFTGEDSDADRDDGAALLSMISWWSDLFEVPCVALLPGDPAKAAECSRRGADFISIDLDALAETGSAIAELKAFGAALDETSAAA